MKINRHLLISLLTLWLCLPLQAMESRSRQNSLNASAENVEEDADKNTHLEEANEQAAPSNDQDEPAKKAVAIARDEDPEAARIGAVPQLGVRQVNPPVAAPEARAYGCVDRNLDPVWNKQIFGDRNKKWDKQAAICTGIAAVVCGYAVYKSMKSKGAAKGSDIFISKESQLIKKCNEAIEKGDVNAVKECLEKGLNVNEQTKYIDETLLTKAVRLGHIDIVRLLLADKKINVNAQSKSGETALMRAVLTYGLFLTIPDIIKLLLSHKDIKVNIQRSSGYTALMDATNNGSVSLVKLLLSAPDIDVNVQNEFSSSALTIALDLGNHWTKVIDLLLSHPKININAQNNQGETPLIVVTKQGKIEAVKRLMSIPTCEITKVDNKK